MKTTKQKLNAAFRALRKAGFWAYMNKKAGADQTKVAFSWGEDGEFIFVHHTPEFANEIVRVLKDHGLDASWDGKDFSVIYVSKY